MKDSRSLLTLAFAMGLGTAGWTASPPETFALPTATGATVSFERDIKPLLEWSCISCHAHGQHKGGFAMDTREQWLAGGDSGPAAVAGESAQSLVVQLVAGADPDRLMPAKGRRWTAEQIGLLRGWIDQGLVWPEGVELGRGAEARLEPRTVGVPLLPRELENPLDRLLEPYFAAIGFNPPDVVDDRLFARRVYLDVIGLLPTPRELRRFERDPDPDKRTRLVERLLEDNQRYAEHWLSFWNDLLRNDYRGTGYIDGGRKQITPWLYSALATNMAYDEFVARLVNPNEHSAGFTEGIVWRGVVNASQRPEMQAAQSISQVFMGINLKCASCHDSFVSNWKLADAYGLASLYADDPLELVRCDSPTGRLAERRFLYPQLGAIPDSTNRVERLTALAQAITRPENGRLTRTIVNRLWARFFGRGLIEPVDEMDNPSWNADVLDWLANDLVEHDYDLKHTMARLLTSRAYQLPSVSGTERVDEQYTFRGPVVRRMTAEQFYDALSQVTGHWRTLPANREVDFSQGVRSDPSPVARWVWADEGAAQAVAPETIYLRRELELPTKPTAAAAVITADNRFTLFVNGRRVGSGDEWSRLEVIDIRSALRAGHNVLAVEAKNDAPSKEDSSPNPAGLFALFRLRGADAGGVWDLGTDATWLCTRTAAEGWQEPEFAVETGSWHPAAVLGAAEVAPWRLEAALRTGWAIAAQYGKVRAVHVPSDPLMTALGRPNREQIVTCRPSAATTLQALEMTNGETLADFLHAAAEANRPQAGQPPGRLAKALFRHALGRVPSNPEVAAIRQTLGERTEVEGYEDLLWSLAMLPEFQLIR